MKMIVELLPVFFEAPWSISELVQTIFNLPSKPSLQAVLFPPKFVEFPQRIFRRVLVGHVAVQIFLTTL